MIGSHECSLIKMTDWTNLNTKVNSNCCNWVTSYCWLFSQVRWHGWRIEKGTKLISLSIGSLQKQREKLCGVSAKWKNWSHFHTFSACERECVCVCVTSFHFVLDICRSSTKWDPFLSLALCYLWRTWRGSYHCHPGEMLADPVIHWPAREKTYTVHNTVLASSSDWKYLH